MTTRRMNTNNGVSKKVEQINDHLFKDTYKSNNIKFGVNDSEMCEMKRRSLVNTGDGLGEYRLRRKGRVKEMGFQLLQKKRG